MHKNPAKKELSPLSNASLALFSFCLGTKSTFSHFYVYFVLSPPHPPPSNNSVAVHGRP